MKKLIESNASQQFSREISSLDFLNNQSTSSSSEYAGGDGWIKLDADMIKVNKLGNLILDIELAGNQKFCNLFVLIMDGCLGCNKLKENLKLLQENTDLPFPAVIYYCNVLQDITLKPLLNYLNQTQFPELFFVKKVSGQLIKYKEYYDLYKTQNHTEESSGSIYDNSELYKVWLSACNDISNL